VAGGWSVSQIDHSRIPGFVIAVNDSALYLPRVDLVVSMDRLWTEHRFNFLHDRNQESWLRRSAVQNLTTDWPWMHVFDCDHESTDFTDKDGWLNGTNSGMCAFNRAYQMRPFELFLFGFDMRRGPKGEAHWFPDYPWAKQGSSDGKLRKWSEQFVDAATKCKTAGISVINASPRSIIKTFPKTTEFMKKRAVA
jgi:hypothetical protein